MKYSAFALLALAGLSFARAESLTRATITEVVNNVTVVDPATRKSNSAQRNAEFLHPNLLRTGADSRAELVAPDNTITRVGANTLFSFQKNGREVNLQQGSVLFHSPAGKGGGTIKTAAATAAVLGTTLIASTTPNGGFKVLMIEGKGRITAGNESRVLTAGQLTYVLPGRGFGPVLNFQLRNQVTGSRLVGGFKRPLPSAPKIGQAMQAQEKRERKGKLMRTNLMAGNDPEKCMMIEPNQREAELNDEDGQRTDGPGGRPFRDSYNLPAVVSRPDLDPQRIYVYGSERQPDPAAPVRPPGDPLARDPRDSTLWAARSATFDTPVVDLRPFEGSALFQYFVKENVDVARSVEFAGLKETPVSISAGQDLGMKNGTTISTRSDTLELIAGNNLASAYMTMEAPNSALLRAGNDLTLTALGSTRATTLEISAGDTLTLRGMRSTTSPIQAAAPRTIRANTVKITSTNFSNITGADIYGNTINFHTDASASFNNMRIGSGSPGATPGYRVAMNAANTMRVTNTLFAAADISMRARTIALENVLFPAGSRVVLDSAVPQLAANPNTGAPVQAGKTNFIRGVRYGNAPAQQAVNPSSGPGIRIR